VRIISSSPAIHRAVVDQPLSRFAESIRSIRLAFDYNPPKAAPQVIGIISALPNEGKSTIAASLAQLIASGGKNVIIVDCDLRNPSLSSRLSPKAAAGLVEVASGAYSLEDAIWRDPKTNLVLLPAVRRRAAAYSSEILSDQGMHRLFERLRATYDYVIVDLPPLVPLVDTRAAAPLIDSFILVVEWGQTKIDIVQHALRSAPSINESLIGAVLNKTNIKAMARYETYLSDYYDGSHYTRYGLSDS
jgi:capsular exopolysaccharide synthesis family protein